MPSAASIPFKSSGLVSVRHRITRSPRLVATAAPSDVKAMRPVAAPGPAGRPLAISWAPASASGSNIGASSESIESAGIFMSARSRSSSPSSFMSTAIRTAASPVRLPLRVCSM